MSALQEPLVPPPAEGRVFRTTRRVRLADGDMTGRLRLDGCARYLQDIGNDDTDDSGIEDPATTWVARRAVIDVHRSPQWRERLDLATWCGGTGSRWAERRLSMVGDRGGRVEIATLWVHVALPTMAPVRVPDRFHEIYGSAAGGRTISAKRWLPGPPDGEAATAVPWPLRVADIDLLGHVNNAAYWMAVEEQLAPAGPGAEPHPLLRGPYRAVMEYTAGIEPGAEVVLRVAAGDRLGVWFTVGGAVHAAAAVLPLPPAARLEPPGA
ncbi:MAG TPA: acyl-ACP thioesterase domain-containing protein [Acidimicrobiales bacterium]